MKFALLSLHSTAYLLVTPVSPSSALLHILIGNLNCAGAERGERSMARAGAGRGWSGVFVALYK